MPKYIYVKEENTFWGEIGDGYVASGAAYDFADDPETLSRVKDNPFLEIIEIPKGFELWGGGDCPFAPMAEVEAVYRNRLQTSRYAYQFRWKHKENNTLRDYDIVGYRLKMRSSYPVQVLVGEPIFEIAAAAFDFGVKLLIKLNVRGWQVWALPEGEPRMFELRQYDDEGGYIAAQLLAGKWIGNGLLALCHDVADLLDISEKCSIPQDWYDATYLADGTPLDPSELEKFKLQLPTGRASRKAAPMAAGLLDYFPDALYDVARLSVIGNVQHNGDEPLHWARGKGGNNRDELIRHTMQSREIDTDKVLHATKVAWRALAEAQLAIEEYRSKGNAYPPEVE